MDSRKLSRKSQRLGLIKNTVDDLLRARRDTIKEKKRQEFFKQVRDFYNPNPSLKKNSEK